MKQTITKPTTLYETDYLLWTENTIPKLKAREFSQVDVDNLIEEIEDLRRSPNAGFTHSLGSSYSFIKIYLRVDPS